MNHKFLNITTTLAILLSLMTPVCALSILPTDKVYKVKSAVAIITDTSFYSECDSKTVSNTDEAFAPECDEAEKVRKKRVKLEVEPIVLNGKKYFKLKGQNEKAGIQSISFQVEIADLIDDAQPQVKYLIHEGQSVPGNPGPLWNPGESEIDVETGELPSQTLPAYYQALEIKRVALNKVLGDEARQTLAIHTKTYSKDGREISIIIHYAPTYFAL